MLFDPFVNPRSSYLTDSLEVGIEISQKTSKTLIIQIILLHFTFRLDEGFGSFAKNQQGNKKHVETSTLRDLSYC
jgi:hypothetical protein